MWCRTRSAARARDCLGLSLGLLLLWPLAGHAKETDSFTHRYEALAFPQGEIDGRVVSDFTGEFNEQFQRVFGQILTEVNEEGRRAGEGCQTDRARRRLFRRLSNGLGGPVVVAENRLRRAINQQPNRVQPRISDSIYRDFAPWRSVSLGLASRLGHKLAVLFRFDLERPVVPSGGSVLELPDRRLEVRDGEGRLRPAVLRLREAEPRVVAHQATTYYLLDNGKALVESVDGIVQVTPILVSSDKFSHFFNRSLGLFKRLGAGSEADIDRVLDHSLWLEASIFGSKSTGVAAYGDLVANFQGMRFWIHLLGRGLDGRPLQDPLQGGTVTPLVECTTAGDWRQRRAVDIRDYLDPAWDEALNCSRLRSPVLLRQVLRRIEALDRKDRLGRTYSCPVDAPLIAEAATGYQRFADRVINSRGHSSLRSRSR